MPQVSNANAFSSLPIAIQNLDVDRIALVLAYHTDSNFKDLSTHFLKLVKARKAQALEAMHPESYVGASVIEGLIKYYQNPEDPKLKLLLTECKKHLPWQDFMVRYSQVEQLFAAAYPKIRSNQQSEPFIENFERAQQRAEYRRSFSAFLTNLLDEIPGRQCLTHLFAMRGQAYYLKTYQEVADLSKEMQPWFDRAKDEYSRRLDIVRRRDLQSRTDMCFFPANRPNTWVVAPPLVGLKYVKHG